MSYVSETAALWYIRGMFLVIGFGLVALVALIAAVTFSHYSKAAADRKRDETEKFVIWKQAVDKAAVGELSQMTEDELERIIRACDRSRYSSSYSDTLVKRSMVKMAWAEASDAVCPDTWPLFRMANKEAKRRQQAVAEYFPENNSPEVCK